MNNPVLNTKLISKKEFESILFSRFGLKLDLNSITKYQDTFSCNTHAYSIKNPLVFTIDFKDKINASWANVYGFFYAEHTNKKTELFKEFREFKDTHTFKIGNYYFI